MNVQDYEVEELPSDDIASETSRGDVSLAQVIANLIMREASVPAFMAESFDANRNNDKFFNYAADLQPVIPSCLVIEGLASQLVTSVARGMRARLDREKKFSASRVSYDEDGELIPRSDARGFGKIKFLWILEDKFIDLECGGKPEPTSLDLLEFGCRYVLFIDSISPIDVQGALKLGAQKIYSYQYVKMTPGWVGTEIFSDLITLDAKLRAKSGSNCADGGLVPLETLLVKALDFVTLAILVNRRNDLVASSKTQGRSLLNWLREELTIALRLRSALLGEDQKGAFSLADYAGYGALYDGLKKIVDRSRARAAVDAKSMFASEDGILLCGPPGNGKTEIARMLAKELGVPLELCPVSSGDHLGESIRHIGAAFDRAEELSPAILFVDECDTIGNRRNITGHNASYDRKITNEFLKRMDGVLSKKAGGRSYLLIAATNHFSDVDEAIRRPGRLGEHLFVDNPPTLQRSVIIERYFQQWLAQKAPRLPMPVSLDPSFVAELVRLTAGETVAELKKRLHDICVHVERIAGVTDGEVGTLTLSRALLHKEGLEIFGWRRHDEKKEARVVAHEVGHALIAHLSGIEVSEIVAVQTSDAAAGGYFRGESKADAATTLDFYKGQIRTALAGHAAEEIVFGTPTAGGEMDLRNATDLARRIVSLFGLGQRSGENEPLISRYWLLDQAELKRGSHRPEFVKEPDEFESKAIGKLLRAEYEEVKRQLTVHRRAFDALRLALSERGFMNGQEFIEILAASQAVPKFEACKDGSPGKAARATDTAISRQ